jgi:transcriptional regulator of heat shock response
MAKNKLNADPELTTRQKNILFATIKEYCDSGQSAGSKELKDKYGFDFSPATIRNELVVLRERGYLFQPFINSSSKPTEKAFKLFINQLIVGLQVTSKQQHQLKKQLEEMEFKQSKLSKEITRLLAFQTGGVGFSLDADSENITGISNLLTTPGEGKVSEILEFLENLDTYKQFLLPSSEDFTLPDGETKSSIRAVIGGENPVLPLGRGYAMVTTEIYLDNNEKSVVGLITPIHLLAKKRNLELLDALSKLLGEKSGDQEETLR